MSERVPVLDERSLRWIRRELRRQVMAALHQMGPQTARTWRPGGGSGDGGGGGGLIPFELYGDLSPPGEAEAYHLRWDSNTERYEPIIDDPPETFTVHDTIGTFRGRGRIDIDGTDPAIEGFRGFARQGPAGHGIVELERGVTDFIGKIDTGQHPHPDGVKPSDEAIYIQSLSNSETDAPVEIWQPTDEAPWFTTSGQPPVNVGNPMSLSSSDAHDQGMIALWWKSIDDLPDDWSPMRPGYLSGIDMTNKFARGRDDAERCTDETLGDGIQHLHTMTESLTGIGLAPLGALTWLGDYTDFDRQEDPGHSHTVFDAGHLPPYQRLHWIEYIGEVKDWVRVTWDDSTEQYQAVKIFYRQPE